MKAIAQFDFIWGNISAKGGPSSGGQKGVFIIAEAGKNFIQTEEDRPVAEYLRNAKELVDSALWAGADAIKFQTHNVDDEQLDIEITAPHFKVADRYRWVKRNTDATPVKEFWQPLLEFIHSLHANFNTISHLDESIIKLIDQPADLLPYFS